jgi:hypothetical protein
MEVIVDQISSQSMRVTFGSSIKRRIWASTAGNPVVTIHHGPGSITCFDVVRPTQSKPDHSGFGPGVTCLQVPPSDISTSIDRLGQTVGKGLTVRPVSLACLF